MCFTNIGDNETIRTVFKDGFKIHSGHPRCVEVTALAQDGCGAIAVIPIIFLTAKTLKEYILEGFKIGADDYITKPFSMRCV